MTEALAFCPGCGCNLAAERPVELGPVFYDPRGDVLWNGSTIRLTSAEHIVFGSLAQARGKLVKRATLEERIGYEGDHRVVDVFITRIRRKLRAAGAPVDAIATVVGRGYRLNVEPI